MQIGLIQMEVGMDIEENWTTASREIARACAAGAQLVVLPEMFCCPYQTQSFKENAQGDGGPRYQGLSQLALMHQVYLVAGSVPEWDQEARDGQGAFFNTCYVFSPHGQCIAKYRKMHLFDVEYQGIQAFRESDTFSSGQEIIVFDTPFARVGVAICYDLRFPELFRAMADRGASLIVVPAAFNLVSGPAHWELLARARALDYQVIVALCSPARNPKATYVTYGHSLIANPWGEIVAGLNEGPDQLLCNLDFEALKKVRQVLPLGSHRRVGISL